MCRISTGRQRSCDLCTTYSTFCCGWRGDPKHQSSGSHPAGLSLHVKDSLWNSFARPWDSRKPVSQVATSPRKNEDRYQLTLSGAAMLQTTKSFCFWDVPVFFFFPQGFCCEHGWTNVCLKRNITLPGKKKKKNLMTCQLSGCDELLILNNYSKGKSKGHRPSSSS